MHSVANLTDEPVQAVNHRSDSHDPDINVVIAQTSSDRVDAASCLRIKSAARDNCAIIRMLRGRSGHGLTEPHARADAYVACVHLGELNAYDVWCDQRHVSSRPLGVGAIHISDMRQSWSADIRGPFDVVNFYIPQTALDDIAEEYDAPRIEELNCPIGLGCVDGVARNLALALLPALARPDQTNRLFAEHASQAVIAHLARSYGSRPLQHKCGRGGLAPWQERRAKELMTAELSGNIGLSELATACRLSPSHFSQAFRQTVGVPPHQWLLTQRVERAKQLLLNTSQSLSEIALVTGFADQSHLTRVFSQRIKTSPAAWRRAQGR